jgi:hypothetical protein
MRIRKREKVFPFPSVSVFILPARDSPPTVHALVLCAVTSLSSFPNPHLPLLSLLVACEWRAEAARRLCLRRPLVAAGSAGGTRRRTCTWTISIPTNGISARSVAHPTPCSSAFRLAWVSVWVVGYRVLASRERGRGFRVVPWPIHRIQPLSILESIVWLLRLGSRVWVLIPRIGWFLGEGSDDFTVCVCCCITPLLFFWFVPLWLQHWVVLKPSFGLNSCNVGLLSTSPTV